MLQWFADHVSFGWPGILLDGYESNPKWILAPRLKGFYFDG